MDGRKEDRWMGGWMDDDEWTEVGEVNEMNVCMIRQRDG